MEDHKKQQYCDVRVVVFLFYYSAYPYIYSTLFTSYHSPPTHTLFDPNMENKTPKTTVILQYYLTNVVCLENKYILKRTEHASGIRLSCPCFCWQK